MNNLKDEFLEKYSRQIIIDEVGLEGQKKILKASISIVGCGGLGTSAAQYLSMSGIGSLTLIDNDIISLSNLNRQTLFEEKDIGEKKSFVLANKIFNINSSADIKHVEEKISEKNINSYLQNSDIILDCTDNFESRLIINNFCHNKKKILISAALQNFEIQTFIFASWKNKKNPCYNCVFPDLTNNDETTGCDEMGIIASVAGIGGLFQANLALNYVLGLRQKFDEFILFDSISLDVKKISVKKNSDCKTCG